MSESDEAFNTKRTWLAVRIFVVVIVFFTWKEMRYALLGHHAQALVTSTNRYSDFSRYKDDAKRLNVEYQFQDGDGTTRRESDTQPASESAPSVGEKIDVEYIAGKTGLSRMASNSRSMPVAATFGVFAVCLTGFALYQGFNKNGLNKNPGTRETFAA